jgi:hypothetical protein
MHHRGMETQLDKLIADMRDVVDQLERVDIDDMRRRLAALEELLDPQEWLARPDQRPVLRLIQGGEGHSHHP